MLKAMRKIRVVAQALALSLALVVPAVSHAQTVDETPSMLAIVTDVAVVRPVMFVVTAVGCVGWVVALPFSAAGGNIKESADVMIIQPAMTTFVRPVGHSLPGYKHD